MPAVMSETRSYQRIVAWTNGSEEAGHATEWAARHAAARALPLHVLRVPRMAALARAARASGPVLGSGETMPTADDTRRLQAEYPSLQVSGETVEDNCGLPGPGLLKPDDILVTWPGGYLDLLERPDPDEQAAAHIPVPAVFVPRDAPITSLRRRVLLLTAPWFFREAASFAFTVAAELGAAMDVVRVPTDYDYMVEPGYSEGVSYAVGQHVRSELAKLRGHFLGVPGDVHTLGARPWSDLRELTREADLAVLGVGTGRGVDVRAVYDLDTCPVAVVPEAPVPTGAPRAPRSRLRPESRSRGSRLHRG